MGTLASQHVAARIRKTHAKEPVEARSFLAGDVDVHAPQTGDQIHLNRASQSCRVPQRLGQSVRTGMRTVPSAVSLERTSLI